MRMTAGENSKAVLKAALHFVEEKRGVTLLTQALLRAIYAWAWTIVGKFK